MARGERKERSRLMHEPGSTGPSFRSSRTLGLVKDMGNVEDVVATTQEDRASSDPKDRDQ